MKFSAYQSVRSTGNVLTTTPLLRLQDFQDKKKNTEKISLKKKEKLSVHEDSNSHAFF